MGTQVRHMSTIPVPAWLVNDPSTISNDRGQAYSRDPVPQFPPREGDGEGSTVQVGRGTNSCTKYVEKGRWVSIGGGGGSLELM